MRIGHIEDCEGDAVLLDNALNAAMIEDAEYFIDYVDCITPFHIDRYHNVDEYKDDNYDVVITDLGLSKTYGTETIKSIRAKTKAPIVVLTGLGGAYLTGTMYKSFLDAGASEVFQKEAINDPYFVDQIKRIAGKKDEQE